MIRGVVGFGCSWIHGDEIDHPTADPGSKEHREYREKNCFLGQLADKLGLECENRGISGGSLQSTIWEFSKWNQQSIDPENWLVIIGLTESSRASWWNGPNRTAQRYGGDYMHNHWDHPGHKWHDFIRWHMVNCDDLDLQSINYWTAVNFFDSFCRIRSIPILQINVFPSPMLIDLPSVYDARFNMRSSLAPDQLAIGRHPNKLGAEWLAEHFTSVIKSRKLLM